MFAFKRFTIHQDRCAMKVGTDGVLLGAWAHVEHCQRILDVGTGTGLIALMAAQRSEASIVGIDLDAGAVAQAAENAASSPWGHRIKMLEADVKSFLHEHCPGMDKVGDDSPCLGSLMLSPRSFDAILCNPPYFDSSLKSPDAARTMARHTDTLSFDELARSASRLLSAEGELSVVIPYERATDMTVSAACHGLFATRQTVVYPVQGGRAKRILMAFTRQGAPHVLGALCIQDAQRQYTPEYIRLVEAFYLKM